MKLALFTPLPPAATGTADYAAALIPELRKLVELSVFQKAPAGFHPDAFDAVIYQIGNNSFHAQIYETALQHPGIVVLHEPNLCDLVCGMNVNRPEAWLREIAYEIFGQEWETVQRAGYSAADQTRPLTVVRRLLDQSEACIVHSAHAAGVVRMKGFRKPIRLIPHGIAVQDQNGDAVRSQLELKQGQPLLGIFGFLRPDKRVAECMKAFRLLLHQHPDARLLIAGKPHPEVPVDSLITELGLGETVIVRDYIRADSLDAYIAACDVVLNLRWPTCGETSGITSRAFGVGKTVVMSDSGAGREYPDDTCVRIPSDECMEHVLAETLSWLLSSRSITDEIGGAARRWAAEKCCWADVARQYAEFATNYRLPAEPTASRADLPVGQSREYLRRWVESGTARASYLIEHEARFCRTLQLIPPGAAGDRILEMGCYMQITPALKNLLGYGEVNGCYLGAGGRDFKRVIARDGEIFDCTIDLFDCERDPFPWQDETFATVVCCELLEHLRSDPMWMMNEIHRVLKGGGILVLSTPNIVSLRALTAVVQGNHPGFYNRYPDPSGKATDPKHEREYTPVEITKLFSAGGFVVEHIETAPYGNTVAGENGVAARLLSALEQSVQLRGDCIFAVGRKANLPRDSRPSWLYDEAIG